MTDNFLITLQISALGMGLVFGAIALLWGVISLLIRLTAERQPKESTAPAGAAPSPASTAQSAQQDVYRRAAVAAAAAALALAHETPAEPNVFTSPPPPLVSAWQAVNRSNTLKKRGPTR